MEREKKRGREGDENKDSWEKPGKKQDVDPYQYHNLNINSYMKMEEDGSYKFRSDSEEKYLALGVFDFPWLKESMISKSEEWNFQDSFSSSLDDTWFSEQCCLCETPAIAPFLEFPLHHIDHIDANGPNASLEVEAVDCVWCSLLDQPLLHF